MENHSGFIISMRQWQEKSRGISKWFIDKDITSVVNALNMMKDKLQTADFLWYLFSEGYGIEELNCETALILTKLACLLAM